MDEIDDYFQPGEEAAGSLVGTTILLTDLFRVGMLSGSIDPSKLASRLKKLSEMKIELGESELKLNRMLLNSIRTGLFGKDDCRLFSAQLQVRTELQRNRLGPKVNRPKRRR